MQFFPMNMAARSANVRLDDLFVPSGTSGDVDFSALLSSHFDQRFSNTTSFTGSNAQQSAAPPPPTPERNPEPSLVQSPPPSSRSDDSRSADTGAPTSQVAPVDQNAPRPAEQSARAEEPTATDEEKSAGVGATEEQGTEDSAQELSTDDHAHAESAATDQPPATGQGHEAAHASSAAHADSEAQHGHDAATADESLEASADGPADAEDTSWTELTQRVETMLSALAELLATLDAETPELQTLKEQVAEKLELVRAKVRAMQAAEAHTALQSGASSNAQSAVKVVLSNDASSLGALGASKDAAHGVSTPSCAVQELVSTPSRAVQELVSTPSRAVHELVSTPSRAVHELVSTLQQIRDGMQSLVGASKNDTRISSVPSAKVVPQSVMALLDSVAQLEQRLSRQLSPGMAPTQMDGGMQRVSVDTARRTPTRADDGKITAGQATTQSKSGFLDPGLRYGSEAIESQTSQEGAAQRAASALKGEGDVKTARVTGRAAHEDTDALIATSAGIVSKNSRYEQPKSVGSAHADEQGTSGDTVSALGSGKSRSSAGQQPSPDARNGFFQEGRQQSFAERPTMPAAKTVGADMNPGAQVLNQQTETLPGKMNAAANMAKNADVYKQVENGAFKDLGQGTKQLVLRLDPAELGQVSVVLQVKGKEVQAVLRTTTAEASQALNDQMTQLKTQLESQGLKVTKLEVQTQLSDSQTNAQWQGAEQHNRQHENRELAMTAQRFRSLGRIDGGLAQDVQNVPYTEKNSLSGVDIFA